MKVQDLSDRRLEYWVGKARGLREVKWEDGVPLEYGEFKPELWHWSYYEYATSWYCTGPLMKDIEELYFRRAFHSEPFEGYVCEIGRVGVHVGANSKHGETKLIAFCRAYVAAKFGDEFPNEP